MSCAESDREQARRGVPGVVARQEDPCGCGLSSDDQLLSGQRCLSLDADTDNRQLNRPQGRAQAVKRCDSSRKPPDHHPQDRSRDRQRIPHRRPPRLFPNGTHHIL